MKCGFQAAFWALMKDKAKSGYGSRAERLEQAMKFYWQEYSISLDSITILLLVICPYPVLFTTRVFRFYFGQKQVPRRFYTGK